MKNNKFGWNLLLYAPAINLITILFGIVAAYFMTIQSLKVELAEKAEQEVVGVIDKKLVNLEVILKEGVVNKEDFFEFSKNIEARLARIEFYLINKSGEQIENKSLPEKN
ncbi:MAG: hypothetical protein DRP35_03995 [Candidatus Zixiibacteriota bacterium]|nr:MAG: hypothetical protein DRP35_03995 [candidate division Zixibacteria bacterium]